MYVNQVIYIGCHPFEEYLYDDEYEEDEEEGFDSDIYYPPEDVIDGVIIYGDIDNPVPSPDTPSHYFF